ncbi:hypothetical protein ILYODFUR_027861 [Ilyodon furcidens]|uniref:Uncharacterized protein n=1 Tax=Ilyodon furcidens TaxID=33524 RepID=A0ABV0VHS6_9TELE
MSTGSIRPLPRPSLPCCIPFLRRLYLLFFTDFLSSQPSSTPSVSEDFIPPPLFDFYSFIMFVNTCMLSFAFYISDDTPEFPHSGAITDIYIVFYSILWGLKYLSFTECLRCCI